MSVKVEPLDNLTCEILTTKATAEPGLFDIWRDDDGSVRIKVKTLNMTRVTLRMTKQEAYNLALALTGPGMGVTNPFMSPREQWDVMRNRGKTDTKGKDD